MKTLLAIIAAFPLVASAQLVRSSRSSSAVKSDGSSTTALTAPSFTASAASGANGLAVTTNGARIDFGAGANDYASSDGTSVTFATSLKAGDITTIGVATMATTHVTAASSIRLTAASTLETCAAAFEGRFRWVTGTGGTNSGARTQLCACTSDGAASPAYAWQNMVTGTVSTATTCAP